MENTKNFDLSGMSVDELKQLRTLINQELKENCYTKENVNFQVKQRLAAMGFIDDLCAQGFNQYGIRDNVNKIQSSVIALCDYTLNYYSLHERKDGPGQMKTVLRRNEKVIPKDRERLYRAMAQDIMVVVEDYRNRCKEEGFLPKDERKRGDA
jgi:hypothetical protein